MTVKEAKEIAKKVARELLNTLKTEELVLDWRRKRQSVAQVRVTIETVLDENLPDVYTAVIYLGWSECLHGCGRVISNNALDVHDYLLVVLKVGIIN